MNLDQQTNIITVRQYKTKAEGIATYDVQMETKEMATLIRGTFGGYWKKAPKGQTKAPIPQQLNNISLTISHTFATRIRVRILRQIAKLHQSANPELSVFVTNYLPRPTLKVRAASGKIDTFNYVSAIKRFSHHLSRDFLVEEAKFAKNNMSMDSLLPHFLVLSPDLILPPNPTTPAPGAPPRMTRQAAKRNSEDFVTPLGRKVPKTGANPNAGARRGSTAAPGQAVASHNPFEALSSPPVEVVMDVSGSPSEDAGDRTQILE